MSKVHVKTGDTVILLTGKDEYLYNDKDNKSKGRKTGKVVAVSPKEGKVQRRNQARKADPHGSGRRHCGNRRCTVRI
mgnify:CR=1 FL=1